MKITLLPLCLALALPAFAQEGEKPQPPARPEKQDPDQKRPKKDEMTEKDPAVVAIDEFIQKKTSTKGDTWRTNLPLPPKQSFAKDADYFWHVKTNKGDLTIRLMPDVAPMHVTSTVYLARLGYYDGLTFHRVIQGFMAQGGCPLGSGTGGPGYKYAGEFDPEVKHDRPGLLSMANAGPNTDGSQFFLTFVPTPHLDGKHTIFGEVVGGMDTLKALEQKGSRGGPTSEKLVMEKTWISVKAKPGKGDKPEKTDKDTPKEPGKGEGKKG